MRFDVRATVKALHVLQSELQVNLKQALGQSAEAARQLAKSTSKFKDRTGALRASIVRQSRGRWSEFVKAGSGRVKYAGWIEDGTEPHIIAARRKKFLRFVQNGEVRFARKVRHPGTQPTYFMRDARDKAEELLIRFVERGVNRALA